MNPDRRVIVAFISALTVVGIFAGLRWEQMSDIRKPDDIYSSLHPIVANESVTTTIDFSSHNFFQYATTTSSQVSTDTITAKAYLVGDVSSGKIYIEQKSSEVLPIASISKLMTAIVATDTFSSTTPITITKEETSVPVDGSNISEGEKFSLSELLSPLLVSSSNIAAEAIASSSNRLDFLGLMMGYSSEIGMTDTSFADPSGLSEYNQSTAADIFVLAKYLYRYRSDILKITQTSHGGIATTTDHGSHIFTSTHPFVLGKDFLGGKTGRTIAAGETMLTILNIKDKPIAFIVLGSQNGVREHDTRWLIDKTKDFIL